MAVRRLSSILTILLVAFALHGRAQSAAQDSVLYKPATERLFQDAMKAFESQNYAQAEDGFLRIVNQAEVSHRTSAAYLMAAKAMYHRSAYRSSADLLRRFLDRFRRSEYIDDAHYTLALDFFQLEQYKECAGLLMRVHQSSPDTALAGRAERMLELIVLKNLQIPDLRALSTEARRLETKAFVSLALAEKVLRTGDARAAREALQPVLTLPPGSSRRSQAEALIERIDRSGVLKVGVVLPLTLKSDQASAQSVGEEMLNGIRLATDEHNQDAMPKVSLEVRNTERDAGVAAREVSLLSSEPQIVAIIGPVFSNEVVASAGLAAAKGIPLISPTATAPGIAAIGESVFQANPDYLVRGRAMAQYAVQMLGARRFAILSANDTMNKLMTGAFIREVRSLGGDLVSTEWYTPGQTDLRDELARIRQRGMELTEPVVVNFGAKLRAQDVKKLLQAGIQQSVIDSLTVAGGLTNVEVLFGEGGARVADSLRIPTQRIRAKYDSLNYPVTGIDAIFLPIAGSDEIGIVTSQIRYFNFQTQLLGTGNWNDPAQLEQNRQYANGAIFAVDTYWEESDPLYQQFARQFRMKYSRVPDGNAMIGYDAMKLLLRAIRQGATSREDIVSALGSSRSLQGVHSKISLGQGRVNSFLTLLQFKGRVIRKIGEIDVSRAPLRRTE
jgi:ABC-type branched-subunit amino acid transport system substrate-binding protein